MNDLSGNPRSRNALRRAGLLALAVLVVVVTAVWALSEWQASGRTPVVLNGTAVPPVPALNPARVAKGAAVYGQYCASCHGANLEGVPDWRTSLDDGSFPPPPHDSSGHTWHHADAVLVDIIAIGGKPARNSRMPGFAGQITPEETQAILDFIKSRWGKHEREFQWWVTASQSKP